MTTKAQGVTLRPLWMDKIVPRASRSCHVWIHVGPVVPDLPGRGRKSLLPWKRGMHPKAPKPTSTEGQTKVVAAVPKPSNLGTRDAITRRWSEALKEGGPISSSSLIN